MAWQASGSCPRLTDSASLDSRRRHGYQPGVPSNGREAATAILLLATRLLLSLIFFVAGVAKLADPKGSRRATTDFGLPAALAPPLAILLPLSELGIAIALIPLASAWLAALAALALLALFMSGIMVNLARGRTPECHCFGQVSSSAIGPKTLLRNAVLAFAALFIVWRGWRGAGTSAVAWLGTLTPAEKASFGLNLVFLASLVCLGWFVLNLFRQYGRLLIRLDSLAASPHEEGLGPVAQPSGQAAWLALGAPAPDFALRGLSGEIVTLGSLRSAGKPVLLVFTDPGCGPCSTLMPEIGSWQRAHVEELTVGVISRGSVEENLANARKNGVRQILLQEKRETALAYRAVGTPSAVLVDAEGRIGSALAEGTDSIRALVAHTLARTTSESHIAPALPHSKTHCGDGSVRALAPPIGEPAPRLSLPDLSGEVVELDVYRGSDLAILFWSSSCGFCQSILGDIKAWEGRPGSGTPQLLIVSSGGTVEQNKGLGFRSRVLIEPAFSAGRAFGASGTPSAILVDSARRIASTVAIGGPAVLELIGARRD